MKNSNSSIGKITSFYFLHIPKTGGTSLQYWLTDLFLDLFPASQNMPYVIIEELDNISPEEINQYKLFMGHFGLKLYDYLLEMPTTITWLRDPVLREISDYFYKKESYEYLVSISEDHNSEWIKYYEFVNQCSLSELCQSGAFIGYSDNLQVRHLSGIFPQQGYVECTQTMLEEAKNNLKNLFYFGICEWMASSIDLLNYYLDYPSRPLAINSNQGKVSAKKRLKQFTEEDIKIISHVNRYDVELYNFAKQEFSRRFQEMYQQYDNYISLKDIPEILNNYKNSPIQTSTHQILYKNFQLKNYDIEQKDQINFTFNDQAFLSNWYEREFSSDKVFRWAGLDTTSTIFFPLKPNKNYQIQFNIINYISLDIIDSLKLQVNQSDILLTKVVIPATESTQNMDTFLVHGQIPAQLISKNQPFTEIKLIVDKTVAKEVTTSNNLVEVRNFSFAIDTIIIQVKESQTPIISSKET
ncbi:sulfotransferase family 2 domain-containing protein [Crocosphaera sp. Alani8]|uniref:sulfotransferase family 2 domain-containing protein n=1 Tax=Crocosphaera sp. Alani8 TaxID=3038952 RepID=UPI00313B052F